MSPLDVRQRRVDGVTDVDFGFCEQCDGATLGNHSCAGFGGSGALRCTASCGVDRASCDDLGGNGRLEAGEPCEVDPATGEAIVPEGVTCESLGLGRGSLFCSQDANGVVTPWNGVIFPRCVLSTYACELDEGKGNCGDGIKESVETCDGTDFGGLTCDQLGLTGSLRCDSNCQLEFSECTPRPELAVCGNAGVETGEECDGGRFAFSPNDTTDLELLNCRAGHLRVGRRLSAHRHSRHRWCTLRHGARRQRRRRVG